MFRSSGSDAGIRLAALDVGSSSLRLLVADTRGEAVYPVARERAPTRLIAGMKDGWLQEDSIRRTAQALCRMAARARGMGAERILAFGTSALRDGRNRDALVALANAEGIEIEVLTGEQEARITYIGAAPVGCAGVLDIGGGSTEMLVGRDGRILGAETAQAGAARWMEEGRARLDPGFLAERAAEALRFVYDAIRHFSPDRWVGAGGTITSLASMHWALETYDPARIEGTMVTDVFARDWLERLCAMPVERRAEIPGLNPDRADIIPFGVAILCAFFAVSGITKIEVSDRDNLIGYIRSKVTARLPEENFSAPPGKAQTAENKKG